MARSLGGGRYPLPGRWWCAIVEKSAGAGEGGMGELGRMVMEARLMRALWWVGVAIGVMVLAAAASPGAEPAPEDEPAPGGAPAEKVVVGGGANE